MRRIWLSKTSRILITSSVICIPLQWLIWKEGIKRPDKSNAFDILCSGQLLKSDVEKRDYEKSVDVVPITFPQSEKEEWTSHLGEVAVSSDAFCKTIRSWSFSLWIYLQALKDGTLIRKML
jgi:hypothetical protein